MGCVHHWVWSWASGEGRLQEGWRFPLDAVGPLKGGGTGGSQGVGTSARSPGHLWAMQFANPITNAEQDYSHYCCNQNDQNTHKTYDAGDFCV